MSLGLCKVILAEQRIEPEIEEEPCKLALLDHKAAGAQILTVCTEDQIDVMGFQMRKGLDDAVRWHDGNILEHHRLETTFIKKLGLERLARVHYQGVRAEMEEPCRVRMNSHSMTNSRDQGPAARGIAYGSCVVVHVRKEVGIAC